MGLGCDFYYFYFFGKKSFLERVVFGAERPVVTLVVQGSIFCALDCGNYTFHLQSVFRFLPDWVSGGPGFAIPITSCVVYTREAGGNTEFALGHSFLSNLVAPFLFPILCGGWLFGVGYIGVSFLSMAERVYPRLGLLVLLPFIWDTYRIKFPRWGNH